MVKLLLFVSLLSFTQALLAQQNLVPNFSFEQNDTCPDAGDQIHYATGWSKYSDVPSTPDYYNSCAPVGEMSVPQSFFCNQEDIRGCNGYAGIVTWTINPNEREHIGIALTQPLVIGQKYFISFYTVNGEYEYAGDYYGVVANNIGIRLSTVPYNMDNPTPIDNYAHLWTTSLIADSVSWTLVTGSIVADSAYAYLIAGNFFDDSNTDTLGYLCGTCLNINSYYLVDNFCISTDSLLCNGGIDLLPCNASTEEISYDGPFSVYPNPASDYLHIKNISRAESFSLTNCMGQIIYSGKLEEGDNIIDIGSYTNGIYFLEIDRKYFYKILINNP